MFTKTAQYYDLIYSFKDYEDEARKIENLIRREVPSARDVLDVACGTGEHARHLSRSFRVEGVDIQPEFVAIAAAKVPSGKFSVADMRDFDLGCQYDVLLCLFGSIGHLREAGQVVSAFRCFRRHVKPGGWRSWNPGSPHGSGMRARCTC